MSEYLSNEMSVYQFNLLGQKRYYKCDKKSVEIIVLFFNLLKLKSFEEAKSEINNFLLSKILPDSKVTDSKVTDSSVLENTLEKYYPLYKEVYKEIYKYVEKDLVAIRRKVKIKKILN